MASFSPRLGDSAAKPVSAKILMDCSGSMGGDSIAAARNALHRIVAGLEPSDKFSLSRFGDTVEHRSRGMWGGTSQAKISAKRWIDTVEANLGGTEMADALISTIAISHSGKSDILLITDGEIEGIDAVIDVATQSRHRVFVVAIGASPAEAHLRRLAAATGGVCDFVAPGENVEPSVLRMFSRMRASRVGNLRVEWPASMKVRWMQAVPDYAFGNDALNLCAFAEFPNVQTHKETVRLWGCLDGSSTEVLLAQTEVSSVESTVNTLARVVAFAQYAETSPKPQNLAIRYQLVTDETNFILVHVRDESEKAKEMPGAHKVPQMLPAGWVGAGSVRYRKKPVTAVYASMSKPSVWRKHSRTTVASSVGGMDSSTTPSKWFRCAPDDAGITPAEFSDWLNAHTPSEWPSTFDGLRNIGLGLAICEWLELEAGQGHDEAVVVRAFIEVVIQSDKQPAGDPKLIAVIRLALQGMQASKWPDAVANFPAIQSV